MNEGKDLVSIVFDVPRLPCGVDRGLDPTKVSISEFIIDVDDLQIPISDAFELLDALLDAHVTSSYRDPLRFQKHEGLVTKDHIKILESLEGVSVVGFHTENAAARPEL